MPATVTSNQFGMTTTLGGLSLGGNGSPMLGMSAAQSTINQGMNLKKFMNQTTHDPNRISITPEEIAALYASSNATQQIIKGKRTVLPKKSSMSKVYNLNQTFY